MFRMPSNDVLGVFVILKNKVLTFTEGGGQLTAFLKILAFFGILLIIWANGFDIKSLLALIFIPLFFIGKPWYKYFSTKTTK